MRIAAGRLVAYTSVQRGVRSITMASNNANGVTQQASAAASASSSAASVAPVVPATAFRPAQRLAKFAAPTVWHEFTPLAAKSKAVNLGQGFPGWSPPQFIKDAAAKAVEESGAGLDFMVNQYARPAGHLSLVTQLAKDYSPRLGRQLDPLTEVVITNGASEGLCTAALGLLNPGDEVVTLEPAFDLYIAQAEMAGATLKTVPYRVKDGKWRVDLEELRAAFTDKTRMFLLNTPHNPTGKVWTKEELEGVAAILRDYPAVVAVCDEVYEHMIYDGARHTSLASLPDMWDRTLTLSSSGKTFSVTGWKIGWALGPAHLVRSLAIAHQWISFSVVTPLQEAVAQGLITAEKSYEGHASYYAWLQHMYAAKRERMCEAIRAAGMEPIKPEGGFFIVADTSRIQLPQRYAEDKTVTRDWALCRWLTEEIGVAAIPPSAFYCQENKHLAANYARFAFCKPDDVLEEAARRLLKCKEYIKKE